MGVLFSLAMWHERDSSRKLRLLGLAMPYVVRFLVSFFLDS